jgi:hypothetical protein
LHFFFAKGGSLIILANSKKKTNNVWPWACIDVKLAAYVEPYYSENRKLTKVVLSKSVNKKTKSCEQLFLHDWIEKLLGTRNGYTSYLKLAV